MSAAPKSKPAKSQDGDIEAWYRQEVCGRLGHTHGLPGEFDCLIETLALARQWRRHSDDGAAFPG